MGSLITTFLKIFVMRIILIKVLTYFKNPERPASIDVMLTNSYRSFQNSCAIETGLSDFHQIIATILERTFKKGTKGKSMSRL